MSGSRYQESLLLVSVLNFDYCNIVICEWNVVIVIIVCASVLCRHVVVWCRFVQFAVQCLSLSCLACSLVLAAYASVRKKE